jgi:hypothetical protein
VEGVDYGYRKLLLAGGLVAVFWLAATERLP